MMVEAVKNYKQRALMLVLAFAFALTSALTIINLNSQPVGAQGYWENKCGDGFYLKGKIVGSYATLRVFTKQTGYNTDWCAFLIHTGITEGKALHTEVSFNAGGKTLAKDSGNFRYYAGPIRTYNRKSVNVNAYMTGYVNGKYTGFYSNQNWYN